MKGTLKFNHFERDKVTCVLKLVLVALAGIYFQLFLGKRPE